MLLLILHVPIFLFVVYVFLVLTWKFWTRKYSFLRDAPNIPWLGTVPYLAKQPHEAFQQRIEYNMKFKNLYVYWLYHVPVIRTGCVEYVEPLLKNQDGIRKSLAQTYIGEWLGDGLITSVGTKWKERRQALTHAFHFNILNDFVGIFEKHAEKLVKQIEKEYIGKTIEVQELMNGVMLKTICESSMGVNLDDFENKDEYTCALEDIKDLFRRRLFSILPDCFYKYSANGKKFYQCVRELKAFTTDVINNNIAVRNKLKKRKNSGNENQTDYEKHSYGTKKKRVFMDLLLDMYDKGEIDVEGIQEEVDTFMAGGHDTTSTAMSWLLYEIARHPDIQRKLQDEIDAVRLQDSDIVDGIRVLKYMECVIKEVLRLHPPIPGFGRKLEKDIKVGDNVVPACTVMQVDLLSVHTNPEYWNDPFVFNPERFNGDTKRANPYCFIPFSAGPRNCIGQKFGFLELKVFTYVLLSKFNIDTKKVALPASHLTTYSYNGIHVQFTKRI